MGLSLNAIALPKGTNDPIPTVIPKDIQRDSAHKHHLQRVCGGEGLFDEAIQLLNDVTRALSPWDFICPVDTWLVPGSAKDQTSYFVHGGEAQIYNKRHGVRGRGGVGNNVFC